MSDPRPRLYDRLVVWGVLLLLVLPVCWRGIVHQSAFARAPRLLGDLQNISCLFSHKPDAWNSYYVQARFAGDMTWKELDQAELFPMQPFGRRTRMHRYFAHWRAKRGPQTEALARWIFGRYETLHPGEPQPVAIRFARAWTIPDPDAPPQKGWATPEFRSQPTSRRAVIVAYPRSMVRDD